MQISWPIPGAPNGGEILVEDSDLTFVSGVTYEHDIVQFRLDILDAQQGPDGRIWPRIFDHATEPILAGTIFPRSFEILAPYFVTYDDSGGAKRVKAVGNVNDNITDVLTLNLVQFVPNNSAGLQRESGVPRRNVPWLHFQFFLVLSIDHATPGEGKSPSGWISKDGATSWTPLTGSFTEKGFGFYMIDLTAAEMDFETASLRFTAPDCDPVGLTIRTAA